MSSGNNAGQRVFTCGHSFHVWVAEILLELANSAGIHGHQIAGVSSIGGSRVIQHWDVPAETNQAKRALREGRVDVLTLSPIWLPDDGIRNFIEFARQHNPAVRVTVQEFWLPNDEYVPVYPLNTGKAVDHDAATIPVLHAEHARYAADIEAHLRQIDQNQPQQTAFVVPVGQASVALRAKILAGNAPGIEKQSELFTDSWGHPTAALMALAAYCHFAVIYRRTPVGLPIPAVLKEIPQLANRELNALLQELAWSAVCEHKLSGVRS